MVVQALKLLKKTLKTILIFRKIYQRAVSEYNQSISGDKLGPLIYKNTNFAFENSSSPAKLIR